jgi:hypothetical protein
VIYPNASVLDRLLKITDLDLQLDDYLLLFETDALGSLHNHRKRL